MSADILRRAAALMRERAERATSGPWRPFDASEPGAHDDHWHVDGADGTITVADCGPSIAGLDDAEHIASWHPAAVLAAALGMDCTAASLETREITAHLRPAERAWIDFARAYLGESS